jgi:exonuclease III
MENVISITSINVRGLGDKKKRLDIFSRLKEQNVMIACLQDVHIGEKSEILAKNQWGMDAVFSLYSSNARGVAILLNSKLNYTIHRTKTDPNGNFLALDITIDEYIRFTLINIYGPNEDKPDFYKNIKAIINSFENESVLLCGDWNMVLNPKHDSYNYKHINNPKARDEVLSLIEEMELVDVWRAFHESENHYTWGKRNPVKMARLDFFLASEDLFSLVTKAKILTKYKSDHAPVNILLTLSKNERGRGNWKFNNSLLSDTKFVKIVTEAIDEIKFQYSATPYNLDYLKICPNKDLQLTIDDQLFLETLLVQLRGKIISYAAKKKRDSQKEENNIETKIVDIDKTIQNDPTKFNRYIDELEDLNLKLENIRSKKIQGSIVRSRANWYELGEKSSKYFLNLENKNYVNKTIQKLEMEDGRELTDIKDILNEQKLFYKKLYENKSQENVNNTIHSYINTDSVNKLSEEKKNLWREKLPTKNY